MLRLGLLLTLAACNYPDTPDSSPLPPTLVITPDEDVAELVSTCAGWINFAAGTELVAIGADGVRARRGEVAGGCGSHDGVEIVIGRCSEVVDLSHIVCFHEVGHALGLAHSRYRGAVMAPQLQQMPWSDAARSLVSALP